MNTSTHENKADAKNAELIDRVIRDAGSIGKVWARYGLEVGKSALQTSATTLQKTASLLGELASRLQDQQRDGDKPTVTTTGQTVSTDDTSKAS